MSPLKKSSGSRSYLGPSTLDMRSLALFRILLGAYLLFDLYSRLSLGRYDLAWYTSQPAQLSYMLETDSPHGAPLHKFWFFRGTLKLQICLFGLTTILASMFALGFYQRSPVEAMLTKVLLWILVVSYQNRNTLPHDGSDSFLRHLLFWSCFLPLSKVWSLDSAYRRNRDVPFNRYVVSDLPCLALTTQIALMYWGTVFQRTLDRNFESQWLLPELSAVHYAMSGSFATRHNILTQIVRRHPMVSRGATAAAMIVEFFAPAWCWVLCGRRSALLGAVLLFLLHAGLLCSLRLPHWQLIGMLVQVIWIPSATWDAWLGKDPYRDHVSTFKKTDGDDSTLLAPNPNNNPARGKSNAASCFIQLFFFAYSLYNFGGCRGWVTKHDNGDIGEGLRLSQYWVMFSTVETVAHNVFVTGFFPKKLLTSNDNASDVEDEYDDDKFISVDLFRYVAEKGQGSSLPIQTPMRVGDSFIEDMSSRFPSARWERAFCNMGNDAYPFADSVYVSRMHQFAKALCTLINTDRLQTRQVPLLQEIEVRYQHLELLPPGSSSRYGKRRVAPDTVTTTRCDPVVVI